MAKWLITIRIILIAAGLLWPLLAQLGLGRLPGDLQVERESYSLYFPITTSIIVSIVISVLLRIFRRRAFAETRPRRVEVRAKALRR